MMITQKKGSRILLAAFLIGTFAVPPADAAKTKKPTSPAELRTDYISRLQEQPIPTGNRTVGSLWVPTDVSDLSGDYKARKLNDTVVILVAVQTTAAQSGDVNSSRAFQNHFGHHRAGRQISRRPA